MILGRRNYRLVHPYRSTSSQILHRSSCRRVDHGARFNLGAIIFPRHYNQNVGYDRRLPAYRLRVRLTLEHETYGKKKSVQRAPMRQRISIHATTHLPPNVRLIRLEPGERLTLQSV